LLGAMLFGQLVDLVAPHLRAGGANEGAEILAALTRGRQVLMGTATADAAIVMVNALGLWLLVNASRPSRETILSTAPTSPPPVEPEPAGPTSSPEPSPPEKFEDVLARYRARHPRS
jgi:hypothetical protein